VTFRPSTRGAKTASLSIANNSLTTPKLFGLTGTGT
jgi:hypothetical protein